MTQPAVSICIPTWNRLPFLKETLKTIESQTFQDFEIIICDDSSDDGTYEYLITLNWANLTVIRNKEHRNFFGSLERLFPEARGEFIAMQHDHDLYDNKYLSKMVSLMLSFPTAGLGCCGYRLLLINGVITEPESAEYQIFPSYGILAGRELIKILANRIYTPIPAMATMFRKEIVQKVGGYRGNWRLASDEDLYRRVSALSDVAFSPERLVTVQARPEDRKMVLGGPNFVFNIFEFRKDTTIHWVDETYLWKVKNFLRLHILEWWAVLKEVFIMWMYGQKDDIEKIKRDHEFYMDIEDRRTVGPLGVYVFKVILAMAKITLALGQIVGKALSQQDQKLRVR
jgi:glycosyltransferase involved in cell wall biosynthesis